MVPRTSFTSVKASKPTSKNLLSLGPRPLIGPPAPAAPGRGLDLRTGHEGSLTCKRTKQRTTEAGPRLHIHSNRTISFSFPPCSSTPSIDLHCGFNRDIGWSWLRSTIAQYRGAKLDEMDLRLIP